MCVAYGNKIVLECVVCRKKEETETGAGVRDFERGWWGWGGCSLEGLVCEGIFERGWGWGEGCSWEGLVWEDILKGGRGGERLFIGGAGVRRHFERGWGWGEGLSVGGTGV